MKSIIRVSSVIHITPSGTPPKHQGAAPPTSTAHCSTISRGMSSCAARDGSALICMSIPAAMCHVRSAPHHQSVDSTDSTERKGESGHARQWNAQSPGLSVTKRTAIQWNARMTNVSRLRV